MVPHSLASMYRYPIYACMLEGYTPPHTLSLSLSHAHTPTHSLHACSLSRYDLACPIWCLPDCPDSGPGHDRVHYHLPYIFTPIVKRLRLHRFHRIRLYSSDPPARLPTRLSARTLRRDVSHSPKLARGTCTPSITAGLGVRSKAHKLGEEKRSRPTHMGIYLGGQ